MIKRILDPEDFKNLINDVNSLFEFENENQGHFFLKHDAESIINSFGNKLLLAWDIFVWGNYNGSSYDALIIFINDKSVKFGKPVFSEYLWLSKNPKAGYKLFKTATEFARQKGFEYIIMNRVMKHPNSHGVAHFYEKMGFVKDNESFISKL